MKDYSTIQTPLLDIACEISGPEKGAPMILLHGWPDDVRTWDRLLPYMHEAGFQTIVPYLRGCGPTVFRSADTLRSGQPAALAQDVLDLADAMGLETFTLVGHDWGARAAYIASCFAEERIKHCVALCVAWGRIDPLTLPIWQMEDYWYQWFMGLSFGEQLLQERKKDYIEYIWKLWNPGMTGIDQEFAATAPSFDNPDWAAITLHSYRVRWQLATPDPRYDLIERKIKEDITVPVPSLVIYGEADPVSDKALFQEKESLFKARHECKGVKGAGHFPQRQEAAAVAGMIKSFVQK